MIIPTIGTSFEPRFGGGTLLKRVSLFFLELNTRVSPNCPLANALAEGFVC